MSNFVILSALSLNSLSVFLQEEQKTGWPWWAWLLLVIFILFLLWLLWWWFGRTTKEEAAPAKVEPVQVEAETKESAPASVTETAVPAEPADEAVTPVATEAVKPDDLEIIEGIGPKIASVLQAAGIQTFKQLAEADLSQVETILKEAGLRLANPASWAEQARLAAEGKWDELKALQDRLKGGRNVT